MSLQIFHGLELPVPQTRFTPLNLRSDLHLLEKSKKHVFKTLHGSQGFGVTWQETKAQSQAQVDAYRTIRSPFLVQELIEDSVGEDIRAFVIQGEVKASMKRKSLGQDLRSNLHQGGSAKPVRLTALEKDLVLSATEGLGLFYAGVDFLRTKNGPLLLEANPSPGFEGISKTCRVDLAEELVQALLAP